MLSENMQMREIGKKVESLKNREIEPGSEVAKADEPGTKDEAAEELPEESESDADVDEAPGEEVSEHEPEAEPSPPGPDYRGHSEYRPRSHGWIRCVAAG